MSTTTEARRTLLDDLAAALVLWAETPAERVERTESDIREVALRAEALGLTELAATLTANANDLVVPLPFRVLRIREALYAIDRASAPTNPSPQPEARPAFARRRDDALPPAAPALSPAPVTPELITTDPRSALEAIDAVEAGLEELGDYIHGAFTATGPREAEPPTPQAIAQAAPNPEPEPTPASTIEPDASPVGLSPPAAESPPAPRPLFAPGAGTPIFDAQPADPPSPPAPAAWARRADVSADPVSPEPSISPDPADAPVSDAETADAEDTQDIEAEALFEPPPIDGGDVADELAELFRFPDLPAALPAPRERPLLADPATLEPISIPAPATAQVPESRPNAESVAPVNYANWFTSPFEIETGLQRAAAFDGHRESTDTTHPEPAPRFGHTPAFANWFTEPFAVQGPPTPPTTATPPAGSIDILLSYDGLADDEGDVVACEDGEPIDELGPILEDFAIEPVAPLVFDEATEPTVEPRSIADHDARSPDHDFSEPSDERGADEFTDELACPLADHSIDAEPDDHFDTSLFPCVTPEDAIEPPDPDAEAPVSLDAFTDDLPLFDAPPERAWTPDAGPTVEVRPQPEPTPGTEAEAPVEFDAESVVESEVEFEPAMLPEPSARAMSTDDEATDDAEVCVDEHDDEPEAIAEPESSEDSAPALVIAPAPVPEPIPEPHPSAHAPEGPANAPTPPGSQGFTISAEHIDTLMDSVRRLVLGKNRLASLASSIHAATASATAPDLAEAESLLVIADEIARVTTDLQSGVMRTRMVTIDELAAPFAAHLRAWADVNRTPVDLEIAGGATLVDSALADAVRALFSAWADALTRFMLKQGTGLRRVRLTAESAGTQIRIAIADDAETFDIAPLRSRAIADGSHAPEDDDEFRDACLMGAIPNTPFGTLASPAVSCDAELTLRPGSGPGSRGNTLSVTIPTRSTVISAMMVRVGDAVYAIPLGAVVEVVKPRREQVGKVNDAPVLRLRNEVFPVLDLHAALGEMPPQASPSAVVAQAGSQTAVLLVTGLIGQREIVIEDLDASSASGPFSGATIRDDGGVSLILDLPQLLRAGGAGLDPSMLELMPTGDETIRRAA